MLEIVLRNRGIGPDGAPLETRLPEGSDGIYSRVQIVVGGQDSLLA
jgi:hypothetical protein